MVDGINHIALSVKNLQESFVFYSDILCMTPVMLSSKTAYLKAGDFWISLIEEKDKEQHIELQSHIALTVRKENFNIIEALLVKYKAIIWKDDNTEGKSFYFKDPSGNKLEIHSSSLDSRIKYGKEHWGNEVQWFD